VPTPTQCVVATPEGRIFFDSTKHDGVAHDVPAEAYRRFRADLRTRREHGQQLRAAQLALHDEKQRFVAEWITTHGTPEQQARQSAGVLPIAEGIEAIADHLFAPLTGHPRYVRNGLGKLQALVQQESQHEHSVVTHKDVVVMTSEPKQATSAQWVLINEFRALVPDATVTLHAHRIRWRRDGRFALPLVWVSSSSRGSGRSHSGASMWRHRRKSNIASHGRAHISRAGTQPERGRSTTAC